MSVASIGDFSELVKKFRVISDQHYWFNPPKFHSLQSLRTIVCLGFARKTTAGARSDTHGLVRDFSGDHTKVFKVRLRRDKNEAIPIMVKIIHQ